MKTYNAQTRISSQLKKAIANTIEYHDKYKSSYFWSNTGNASNRRSEEKKFVANNPEYEVITKKGIIKVSPSLSISCKNVYYSLYVTLDGEKKNISLLKKLVK